jgi:PQQ-dependent dehydrogenase (methanol/ethanol family)
MRRPTMRSFTRGDTEARRSVRRGSPRSTRLTSAAAIAWVAIVAGCGTRDAAARPDDRAPSVTMRAPFAGAPDARVVEDGQWPIAAKDFGATRYSGLAEITTENVGRLALKWTFSSGRLRGHEAPPLVVGSTMYVTTPFPNQLVALDLASPGAPMKWTYRPPIIEAAEGVACCDIVNRGAAYADGRVFLNTLDNQTVAVDARTGKEVWRVRTGDIHRGETITMAPLVVKGKVLVGNSGGEFGVRGKLTALDAATGKIVWRAYSTGPDDEVLIGPSFKPHYAQDRGKDLGVSTWPADAWKIGGGTVWGWLSYDPELDLVYYGTGNPGPWNAELRPGDNKWTAGIFARDPDDGQARWFYQWSPHDLYDWDGVNENVLVDLPVDGPGTPLRKVLLHADRNGYLYMLDRATGEVLKASPFAYITALAGIDLTTGRPNYVPAKHPKTGTITRDVCPPAPGAKDWQPTSFSPRTGWLYIPHQNMCMDVESVEANYIEGTPYVGANTPMKAGPGGHRGEVTAWDPIAAREVWTIRESFPVWSGTVVTAGDVVFYGTLDRWFKAVDARTGKELWRFRTASGIIGQPISFRGPDGKQYVAVFDGVGGWAGAVVAGDLTTTDSNSAIGMVGATEDLPKHTEKGGTLYVFGLP